MNLRHTPELVIMLDTTIDRGMHIDDLIRRISNDKDDKNGTT